MIPLMHVEPRRRLYLNAALATMDPARPAPYGAIADGALLEEAGRIEWVGARRDAPVSSGAEIIDLGGAWLTPALVDCHTHAAFAGERAGEFERRLQGATYEEIAKAGGGIMATVKATRAAAFDDLVAATEARLAMLRRGGVASVEIKSGYGLDLATELRLLEAAGAAAARLGLRVSRTLLGLHALPPEFKDDRAGYVRLVCERMIPEAAARGLVDAVDAYCEGVAFTRQECRRVFEAAKAHGLPVKLHAEQFSDQGGAALAAEFGALSADHLEYLSEMSAAAMAQAGTVAVLLPAAYYVLREKQRPPVDLLRRLKVAIAVATDLNPGTAPLLAPTLAMNMACTLFALTPEEALAGMTREGARALGLTHETGMLRAGLSADLALWRIAHPLELSYWIGLSGPERLIIAGREILGGEAVFPGP